MKEISIQNGDYGISYAIKRELQDAGATNIKGSIWGQIQQLFVNETEGNKSTYKHSGVEENIGDAWQTLKSNVMVFVNDVIKISDATWNKICELAGVETKDPNPPQADTNPPQNVGAPKDYTDANPPQKKEQGHKMDIGYDANGNETKYVWYNSDGTVHYYQTMEYDENGNVTKRVGYNPDGTVRDYTEYIYDGNVKKEEIEVKYNDDGTVYSYNKVEYDANGNCSKYIMYNSNGTVKDYYMDVDGKRTWYNANGTVNYYYKSEYDENGNEISRVYYNSDGEVIPEPEVSR